MRALRGPELFPTGKVRKRKTKENKGLQSFSKMASSGSTHSLFLDDSGSLWSCGANNVGQLATERLGVEVQPCASQPSQLPNSDKQSLHCLLKSVKRTPICMANCSLGKSWLF